MENPSAQNNDAPEKRRRNFFIKKADVDISLRVDILDVDALISLEGVATVLEHGQKCVGKHGTINIFVEPIPVLDIMCSDDPVPRIRDTYDTLHWRLFTLLLESETTYRPIASIFK